MSESEEKKAAKEVAADQPETSPVQQREHAKVLRGAGKDVDVNPDDEHASTEAGAAKPERYESKADTAGTQADVRIHEMKADEASSKSSAAVEPSGAASSEMQYDLADGLDDAHDKIQELMDRLESDIKEHDKARYEAAQQEQFHRDAREQKAQQLEHLKAMAELLKGHAKNARKQGKQAEKAEAKAAKSDDGD
jgi:hypothetical protein